MHMYTYLSTICLVCCITAATPVEPRAANSRFSIQQSVPKPSKRSGPAALISSYVKFNKKPPAEVRAAAAQSDGTVSALPEELDVEYLSPVSIGGQILNLNVDTGSADLWVFATSLSTADQHGHSIYDPSKSSTSRRLQGETWKVGYGDGSGASGNVYTDTVQLGSTKAANQAVEAANLISPEFQRDIDNDGLLGLAFDHINQVQPDAQRTFFSSVKRNLASPLFTADLHKGRAGSYDFGFIDDAKYTGRITYVPVDSTQGFWGFSSNGYAIGGNAFTTTSIKAIMDTGTTLLLLPDAIVSAYYSKVQGATYNSYQGGFTFPCSVSLPSITLGIGDYKAVVPGSYMIYAPLGGGSTSCFGGIQRNTGIPFAIFGDVFIKSQFIVFNSVGPRLGVATKRL